LRVVANGADFSIQTEKSAFFVAFCKKQALYQKFNYFCVVFTDIDIFNLYFIETNGQLIPNKRDNIYYNGKEKKTKKTRRGNIS